jgi:cell division protein FtsA
MKRDRLVAGLDLGSTKTCAVIAEAVGDARFPGVKVLGVGVSRASGIRRGMVRDIEETMRGVGQAMRDAERMAGVPVPAVCCGVAGEHVRTRNEAGLASVSGDEIGRADVQRVDGVAKAVSLGPDRELLHFIPQEYRVDGQGGISDPVGMTGLRLEVDMYLVSIQSTAVQNLRRAVERAGHRVAGLVLEPLASSLAVLTEEERELGCVLIELGGNSTTLAIFKDGKIRHYGSLGFAGSYVTSDIVQGLGVTQADAERLKERFGVAYTPLVDPEETIELPGTPGQGPRRTKRELLAHIIHQRIDEILGLVQQDLESVGYAGRLPAGAVLTGGGAHLAGITELAREVLAMPVRLGVPDRGVSGLVDSVGAPRYAVAVGLALWAARQRLVGSADGGGAVVVDKWLGPVKRWLQDFF